MALVSEGRAEALHRQGVGLAKHKGYTPGGEKYNAAVYGTKRAGGWKPSREVRGRHRIGDAVRASRKA